MHRILAVLLGVVCVGGAAFAGPDLQKLRSSVVKVFADSQREDYTRPWQSPRPVRGTGSAFFIGDKLLMTNAHVVSDSRVLRVKRADRPTRYDARRVYTGHDCDLAVLTVDDPAFWEDMAPLEFGPRPAIRSSVSVIGYPTGGTKLSVTDGVVNRIEMQGYSHTVGDSHLTIQIDAAINPGNSGGPVLQDNKIVGVAFQGRRGAQNLGYMIPPSVIAHFLKDVADKAYDGYPELGLETSKLENETLREYLRVPKGATGVIVLKALPFASCDGHLERNDVLHAIDGIPIQNDGTIKVDGEFLDLSFVVENKQVGESVKFTIRREGKEQEVEVPLRSWGARMKFGFAYDKKPEYLVLGGYVFVPLSFNYVVYQRSRREELIYYLRQFYRTPRDKETREQLVILSKVLPDRSTRYRKYANSIVATVNGKAPLDFAQFVEMLDKAPGDQVRIDFEGVNVAPIILDRKKLEKNHPRILKRNGILNDRHVDKGDDK